MYKLNLNYVRYIFLEFGSHYLFSTRAMYRDRRSAKKYNYQTYGNISSFR